MAHTATAATQTRDQPLASRVTWENGGNREIDSLVADEVAATAASALAAFLSLPGEAAERSFSLLGMHTPRSSEAALETLS